MWWPRRLGTSIRLVDMRCGGGTAGSGPACRGPWDNHVRRVDALHQHLPRDRSRQLCFVGSASEGVTASKSATPRTAVTRAELGLAGLKLLIVGEQSYRARTQFLRGHMCVTGLDRQEVARLDPNAAKNDRWSILARDAPAITCTNVRTRGEPSRWVFADYDGDVAMTITKIDGNGGRAILGPLDLGESTRSSRASRSIEQCRRAAAVPRPAPNTPYLPLGVRRGRTNLVEVAQNVRWKTRLELPSRVSGQSRSVHRRCQFYL